MSKSRALFSAIVLFATLGFAPSTFAQVVYSPSIPQPTISGQVVGANFQNPTGSVVAPHAVVMGQAFVSGAVPGSSGLSANINGTTAPTQLDVKTTFADGSAKFGVVTVMAPQLAANSTNPTMFSLGTKSGAAISLATMPGYAFSVDIVGAGTMGTYHYDVAALLAAAVSAGTVTYWRQGPVVTEGRIDVPVTGALHIVFDISKYQDGSYSTDVQFNNDVAKLCASAAYTDTYCSAPSGKLTYTTTLTQNGTVVYQSPSLAHFQYEQWHKVFWTNASPVVNVQNDVPYLIKAGVLHNYDLAGGVSSTLVSTFSGAQNTNPFSPAGITQYMGMTGDRPDIGPTTEPQAIWLFTGNPNVAKYVLAQADAAAGIPWHFWYSGTWLNTDQVPNIWVMSSAHPSGTTALFQAVDGVNNGWSTDTAHMPDLSYIPYLLRGSRYYLDQLNAQAAYGVTSAWPSSWARNNGQGLVIPKNQLRAGAWALRQVNEAAWANPAGTPESNYFIHMSNNNYSWLNSMTSYWTSIQGPAAGYLGWDYGAGDGTVPPWQNDYLASSVGQAAAFGVTAAATFLGWQENYLSTRFLNAADGGNPHDGCAYNVRMAYYSSTTGNFTFNNTWPKINAATIASGQSNGSGWVNSNGDYCQLSMMALAEVINNIGSSRAQLAYSWVKSSGAPYTTPSTMLTKFRIIPKGTLPPPPVQTADTIAPSVPSGLTATVISGTQVNLSWTASTDNVGVSGYKIMRNGVQIGTTAATTYQSTGLTAGTTYSYTVSAYDVAGNTSAASAAKSVTTTPVVVVADTTAPAAPASLAATAISSTQVNLSWTAATDNIAVTGYKVLRNGTQVALVTTTSYSDMGLTANSQYVYTVSAYDAAGNTSVASPTAFAATPAATPNQTADTIKPSVPTGLTATAASSVQINLAWTASTDNVGVSGYKIMRNGVQIGTTATRTFQSTGLTAGTAYSYTVSAYDAAGNASAASAAASATTQAATTTVPPVQTADTTVPTAPGLSATPVSFSQINLSWTASTDNVGVTGYKVYRAGVQIATTAGTSYQDSGLTASKTYSYTVTAYDAAGNVSRSSAEILAATLADPSQQNQNPGTQTNTQNQQNANSSSGSLPSSIPDTTGAPSVPTGLTAIPVSDSQINLVWNQSSGSVAGYRVYRAGTLITTTAGTSYQDAGLMPSKTYSYTVIAYGATGDVSRSSIEILAATLARGATANGSTQTATGTANTQASVPVITRPLYYGLRGDDVIELQKFLVAQNLLPSTSATGFFGAITQAAVQRYQCNVGIVCSGTADSTGYGSVGPKTILQITGNTVVSSGATQPATTPVETTQTTAPVVTTTTTANKVFTRTLRYGMTGDDVLTLEKFLSAHGYLDAQYVDTFYGLSSVNAIKRFQLDNRAVILTPNQLTQPTVFFGPATQKVVEGMMR